MIFLSPGEQDLTRVTGRAGAFYWWYLDMVDSEGNGLVAIWSAGLPLLPGNHAIMIPENDPSFNLAIYRNGRPDFYLLQRYAPADVSWEMPLQMGQNRLHCRPGEVVLEVDSPIPGEKRRVQGEIRITGTPVAGVVGDRGQPGAHRWGPAMAPARGVAKLEISGRSVSLEGRAYHDSNQSECPLDQLGISHWLWGRVSMPNEERIWYLVWPKAEEKPIFLDMRVGADGMLQTQSIQPELGPARRDRWGMPWWQGLGLPGLKVRRWDIVDRGPFYLRFLVEAEGEGGVGHGFAEVVNPDRVNIPWMKSLIETRIHTLQRQNSPMTAWFNGSVDGRYSRLWSMITGSP